MPGSHAGSGGRGRDKLGVAARACGTVLIFKMLYNRTLFTLPGASRHRTRQHALVCSPHKRRRPRGGEGVGRRSLDSPALRLSACPRSNRYPLPRTRSRGPCSLRQVEVACAHISPHTDTRSPAIGATPRAWTAPHSRCALTLHSAQPAPAPLQARLALRAPASRCGSRRRHQLLRNPPIRSADPSR